MYREWLKLFPGCCAAPLARSRASSTRYGLRRGALLIRGSIFTKGPGSAVHHQKGRCTASGIRGSVSPDKRIP